MSAELDDVPAGLRPAVEAALAAAGVEDGHLSVDLVAEDRMRELNREHRGRDQPTDVLSFPVDGVGPTVGPRELGDVAICPEHTDDLTEAVVHGVLHLCGYDHEADDGEMLALQERVLAGLGERGASAAVSVREAHASEVDKLLPMYEWLFAAPGAVPEDWDPERGRAALAAAIESDRVAVLVGELDGRPAGICTAYLDLHSVRFGPRCWVEDLAVDPERRSRGVGEALLELAREWARARGATHLELDTAESRVDSQRFYERREPAWRSISYGWRLGGEGG